MTFLSRTLGFVRDMIIAHVFGATGTTDAFFVAFKIPNFMRRLFAEGAFSQAFVPVLSEYKMQKSPEEMKQFINHISGTLGLIVLVVSLIGIIAAPLFVMIFSPGFHLDGTRFELTTHMLRITFPYIFFISLTAFAGSVLNTHNHFAGPAFTPVLLNVCMIIAAVWMAPHFAQPIVALAWGVFIAGAVQMVFQWPFLWHFKVMPRFKWMWRDPGVQRVMKLMLPALFGVSVGQIGLLMDTMFASFLPAGSISWLYNSERVMTFPLGVFGVAIATVVLPHLSKKHATKSTDEYGKILVWGIQCVFLIGVPAGVLLIYSGLPILMTLLNYGHFTQFDVIMTQQALMAYSIGIPFMMVVKILAAGFYARQNIKTPVKIGVIALVFNVLMNFLLIHSLKHAGLALASSLATILNTTVLAWLLVRSKILPAKCGWGKFFMRLIVANAAMLALIWWLQAPATQWFAWHWQARFLHLLMIFVGAGIVYLVGLWLVGFRWRELKAH
jgi:putative peptidoglycan lipid II flippase